MRKGFSVTTSPNLNAFGWNLENKCGTKCALTQKFRGNRPRRSAKWSNVFFSVFKCVFLSPIQRDLSDTYLALISTMFETTDVNRCAWVYIYEKCQNFCVRVLLAPKNCPRSNILGEVLVTSIQLKQHNFRRQESLRGLVNISRKCHLCTSFEGETYSMGLRSPK